jgi:hypothetical protein
VGCGATTKLSLVHEDLDQLAGAMPEVAENVGPGWEDAQGDVMLDEREPYCPPL